jgi:hypothetical protein
LESVLKILDNLCEKIFIRHVLLLLLLLGKETIVFTMGHNIDRVPVNIQIQLPESRRLKHFTFMYRVKLLKSQEINSTCRLQLRHSRTVDFEEHDEVKVIDNIKSKHPEFTHKEAEAAADQELEFVHCNDDVDEVEETPGNVNYDSRVLRVRQ